MNTLPINLFICDHDAHRTLLATMYFRLTVRHDLEHLNSSRRALWLIKMGTKGLREMPYRDIEQINTHEIYSTDE